LDTHRNLHAAFTGSHGSISAIRSSGSKGNIVGEAIHPKVLREITIALGLVVPSTRYLSLRAGHNGRTPRKGFLFVPVYQVRDLYYTVIKTKQKSLPIGLTVERVNLGKASLSDPPSPLADTCPLSVIQNQSKNDSHLNPALAS
jgi:hypothetical protein